MIDLNKIIKLIKNGKCSYNAFNIKKSQGYEDPAAQWIAQEEARREKDIQEQPEKIFPVPSDIPVSQPSQQVPSQNIIGELEVEMDTWIKSNQQEIVVESRNDVIDLLKKKNEFPEESALDPSVTIYRALNSNPNLYQTFAEKIKAYAPEVGDVKANIFVETMVAKTQGLMEEITAREEEIKKEEEASRRTQEQKQRKKEEEIAEDPYAYAVPIPDPGIAMRAYEKFLNLSPEEKEVIYDVINMKYQEEKLPAAIEYKLSAPEKAGGIDQRMNFFLNYPQYIERVIDPNLENIIQEELLKKGIQSENIFDGIFQMSQIQGGKKRISNILNNVKGEELYNILLDLIDEVNPVIFEWMKSSLLSKDEMRERTLPVSSEGKEIEQEEKNIPLSDIARQKASAYEQRMSSEIFSSVLQQYLNPILQEVDNIRKNTIDNMMSDSIGSYKNAVEEVEGMVEYTGEKGYLKKKKLAEAKASNKQYTIAEQLNTFSISAIEGFYKLLQETQAKKSYLDPEVMTYKSKERKSKLGRLHLPKKVLQDILKRKEGEENVGMHNYARLAQRYKDRIESGEAEVFIPKWKDITNYGTAADSLASLGNLKEKIINLNNNTEIHKGNIDVIMRHIDASAEKELLEKFARTEKRDSESKIAQKKQDFIYMTLAQNNDFPNYISGLQKLGKPREKEDPRELGKSRKKEDSREHYHSLKVAIGDKIAPLLGYLSNYKENIAENIQSNVLSKMEEYEQKYNAQYDPTDEDIKNLNGDTSSMNAFVSLLDQHSNIRRFKRHGRMPNLTDRWHRTNTEIYYDLIGKDIPPHVKEMLSIYKKGVNESEDKDSKLWYNKFFKAYDKLDSLMLSKNSTDNNIKKFKQEKEEHYDIINRNVSKIINPVNKNKRGIGEYSLLYRKVLNNIKETQGDQAMIDFKNKMRKWDKSSHLLPEEYNLFGLKLTNSKLETLDKNINGQKKEAYWDKKNKRYLNINELDKKIEVYRGILSQTLKQRGYSSQSISALRLAHIAYERMLFKLSSLEKIRITNIKVSSTDYINKAISNIVRDFDYSLDTLFGK